MPATIICAESIPVRATTEPTERSMPAINIAKNSPIAMRILTELCERICVRVAVEKKVLGLIIARINSSNTKIPIVPYFCQIELKVTFSFFLGAANFLVILFTFLSELSYIRSGRFNNIFFCCFFMIEAFNDFALAEHFDCVAHGEKLRKL